MNIAEAKEQIKRSVSIYLAKNEDGSYRIPVQKQRPVFLYGAPGIGKTAIMEQISEELGISLVSYSMTHHTRQSALGLPFIVKKKYGGEEYDISRYTMSEIIASVYDKMEETGRSEGILFLDEINCVSETLGPAMLQFLQYKVFGSHKVPDGWVVVTAGNPPEFNRSVRTFDVVTMDRMKIMEVEPDFEAWRMYAVARNIHKAILSYLDIKKEDFYEIETTVDGKNYVTARGWEDLSEAILLYEEKGYPVDETLVSQYLQNHRVQGEFAAYYELYQKYRTDYQIHAILEGKEDETIRERAAKAAFDERITIIGLLMEALMPRIKENMNTEDRLVEEVKELRRRKTALSAHDPKEDAEVFLQDKAAFEQRVSDMKTETRWLKKALSSVFGFVADNFGIGNEMLILVTELTVNYSSARFIAEKGCDEYFKYDKRYLLYERNKALTEEIMRLEKTEGNKTPSLEIE